MSTCKPLYNLCLEFCIPKIENYSRGLLWNPADNCKWIENLESQLLFKGKFRFPMLTAGPVVEDLLKHAFQMENKNDKSIRKVWKEEWKIFFTSKITSALLCWDSDLINYISDRCKNLRHCEVVLTKNFDPDLILKLPKSVVILDFDGELVKRGQATKTLLFEEEDTSENWLQQAEKILRALWTRQMIVTNFPSTALDHLSLSELHLGDIKSSASDLKIILKNCPCLRLLRHYQMVTALYELHCEEWKKKRIVSKYKLRNLDVDFSHVVRCRMSPEKVLSSDALQVAVAVCPSATSIRVRFDCSTPHDVLNSVTNLSKVKEFSAVCVTSGERTLLDFSDMIPIFEKFGPISLIFLELKVIEEVEIHVIIECCTKLETLILSGCGYVTPPTCSSFNCKNYKRGSFKKLLRLFYADGDDFSWDHGVPECFWKASIYPSERTQNLRLQGLFLEYPRMSLSLIKELLHPSLRQNATKIIFPELQVLSFCRFEEITADDIAAFCGFSPNGSILCPNLKYIRLSECEKITESEERRLRKWAKHSRVLVKIDVDR